MCEKLTDRRDAFGSIGVSREQGGHSFEELVHVTQKQIVLIPIVCVERRPADLRAIEHLLHGDIVKGLREQQLHQGIA
jgi:hypothetical protein